MTDPRHLAFFTFPFHGHVNPTLGLVSELVRRGHRVTYVTTKEFADAVAAVGAEAIVYEGTVPSSLDTVMKAPDDMTSDELHLSIKAITDEGLAPLAQVRDQLAGDPPDLVLHDLTAFHTGRLAALAWNRPAIRLCTTLVYSAEFNPYAEYMTVYPDIDPGHSALAEERASMVEALASVGLDHLTPEEFKADESTVKANLVFLPERFQVGPEHFGPEYAFVGPCLTERTHQGSWRPSKPRAEGAPLVLIAFGTFAYPDQQKFFTDCAHEFAGTPWHVVLVVGNQVDVDELGELPSNVEMHRWVPQFSLLSETDVFVSHAGMGSVTEAVYTGTPMVLLPKLTEQDLVASRVRELGLGRTISREDVTATAIRDLVAEVLEDREIPANLAAMRKAMADAGGAPRAADVIEKVIEES
ncbi:macrolide family glycosyltransferase [Amycolatopsis minnesotensis]|uniref:Glycosyltransferase n=1 Tax=Amycolatopsis minnesotensis TaxID=337894 RepID=A0ABN2SZC1_9PSEU